MVRGDETLDGVLEVYRHGGEHRGHRVARCPAPVAGEGHRDHRHERGVRRAAVALTETPFAFDAALCADLRAAGFDEQSILDLIYASSFFNWANRLMLTLGQPDVPKRFR